MLAGFAGCSSKDDALTADNECVIEGLEAPAWICEGNQLKGYYIAVGNAPTGKLGQGFARREAMANARSNLARQIQADTKGKVAAFAHETGLGDDQVAKKVSATVSTQVARLTLGGSKQLKYWQSPSQEIYLLVGVPIDRVNKEVQRQVQSNYRSDQTLWRQFQEKNAMEALENAFPVHY